MLWWTRLGLRDASRHSLIFTAGLGRRFGGGTRFQRSKRITGWQALEQLSPGRSKSFEIYLTQKVQAFKELASKDVNQGYGHREEGNKKCQVPHVPIVYLEHLRRWNFKFSELMWLLGKDVGLIQNPGMFLVNCNGQWKSHIKTKGPFTTGRKHGIPRNTAGKKGEVPECSPLPDFIEAMKEHSFSLWWDGLCRW